MVNFVETTSRRAQWRIDFNNVRPSSKIQSDPFKIGKWNWCFVRSNNINAVGIKLFLGIPQAPNSSPIASFSIHVVSLLDGPKILFHQEYKDRQLMSCVDNIVWTFNNSLKGTFIIDVEFLDLKISSPNEEEARSIWSEGFTQKMVTNSTTLSSLGRMLSESIYTDITIHTSDGTIEAHRAVLAAHSPVFHSMFSHNLQEKEMSTINISDMSIEACKSFLNYIYSNLQYQDFIDHRLDLLRAAEKYDILDLKNMCEESLIEDINMKNVLERLQTASMYHLPMLKASCLKYLLKFGKIYDIREELNVFIQSADRELIGEVFNEIWEGFLNVDY